MIFVVKGGFLSVLGFLVIFRTSGAHARFVTGSHAASEMAAAYFDSASTLMCFLKAPIAILLD